MNKKEALMDQILAEVAQMKIQQDPDLDKLIAWVKKNRKKTN